MYYDWREWGEVKRLNNRTKNGTLTENEQKWQKWLKVNRVVPICLTLKDATDTKRLERARREFERVGLGPFMRVFYARRPNDEEIKHIKKKEFKGAVGCWFSHLSIMDWMLKKHKKQRALIFEDDVVFSKDTAIFNKFLKNSTELLKKKDDELDILYLGHLPLVALPSDPACSAWRVFSLLTHAYLIQAEVMKALVDDRYKKGESSITRASSVPIDAVYHQGGKPDGHQFRAYANFPMICPTQAPGISDIQKVNAFNDSFQQNGPVLAEAGLYFIVPAVTIALIVAIVILTFVFLF